METRRPLAIVTGASTGIGLELARQAAMRGYDLIIAANESLDLAYSLSDRVRYYWPHPEVARACGKLLENLHHRPPPLTLVSQYLPRQYAAIRSHELDPGVDALLRDGVAESIRPYLRACGA